MQGYAEIGNCKYLILEMPNKQMIALSLDLTPENRTNVETFDIREKITVNKGAVMYLDAIPSRYNSIYKACKTVFRKGDFIYANINTDEYLYPETDQNGVNSYMIVANQRQSSFPQVLDYYK